VIIDVLCIALGFVLRVIAGAVVISVPFSPWLVFCTFFLTLFLAVTKRKSELRLSESASTRSVLGRYSLPFLDQMNTIVLPLTLITYTFYTFSSEHSRLLMLTVPIVLFGLFRYLYITEHRPAHNDGPTDSLYTDRQLQATVAAWVVMVVLILYYAR
jgi:4-hydroxybenzoate polyprenyltransferase